MLIFLIKILITSTIVIGLSLIAEKASPKMAGVLSGLPLGAVIVLFFIGLEQGPEFGAKAGISMVLGLTSTLALLIVYWQASQRLFIGNSIASVTFTAICGLITFLVSTYILSFAPERPEVMLGITSVCCALTIALFKNIPNTVITQKVRFTSKVLLIRASMATATVLIVTGTAEYFGPFVAGLLAGFPFALFPLILIIHKTYSTENVWSIIKNFPAGMVSLIIYGFCASIFYPSHGLVVGTLISFAISAVYTTFISVALKDKK
jgi:hypothetical protein